MKAGGDDPFEGTEGYAGTRTPREELSPAVKVEVNGIELRADLMSNLKYLEWEGCTNMVGAGKIVLNNPGFRLFRQAQAAQIHGQRGAAQTENLTEHIAFKAGQVTAFHFGYGAHLSRVGVGLSDRALPDYPASGMPEVTIPCYTADKRLMGVQGPVEGQAIWAEKMRATTKVVPAGYKTAAQARAFIQKKKTRVNAKNDQGHIWKVSRGVAYKASEIVTKLAAKYGMEPDIPEDEIRDEKRFPKPIVQSKGTSDYDLLKRTASWYGKDFWVSWQNTAKNPNGTWVLHWRYPANRQKIVTPMFRFVYGPNDAARSHYGTTGETLISFRPAFAMQDTPTAIEVGVFDGESGEFLSVLEDSWYPSPDSHMRKFREGGGTLASADSLSREELFRPFGSIPRKPPRLGAFAGSEFARVQALGSGAFRGAQAQMIHKANMRLKASFQRWLRDRRDAVYNRNRNREAFDTDQDWLDFQIKANGVAFDFRIHPDQLGDEESTLEDKLYWLELEVLRITQVFRDGFLTGEAVLVGNELVREGQVHWLDGLDPFMCGLWEVKKARHVYDPSGEGYRTLCSVTKVFL